MLAPSLGDTSLSSSDDRARFDQLTQDLRTQHAARQVKGAHWLFEVVTQRGRTQLVHVTCQCTGQKRRPRVVVLSAIGPVPSRLDAETLLRRNATLNVGAICIVDLRDADQEDRSHLAVRATQLLRTARASELQWIIDYVARVADDAERELFGLDYL